MPTRARHEATTETVPPPPPKSLNSTICQPKRDAKNQHTSLQCAMIPLSMKYDAARPITYNNAAPAKQTRLPRRARRIKVDIARLLIRITNDRDACALPPAFAVKMWNRPSAQSDATTGRNKKPRRLMQRALPHTSPRRTGFTPRRLFEQPVPPGRCKGVDHSWSTQGEPAFKTATGSRRITAVPLNVFTVARLSTLTHSARIEPAPRRGLTIRGRHKVSQHSKRRWGHVESPQCLQTSSPWQSRVPLGFKL